MIEDLVEESFYPMELVLLQETSISLTELDSMDEERKWMYYYYIVAAKKKEEREAKEAQEQQGTPQKGKPVHMDFPPDFVSVLELRGEKDKRETGTD